MTTPKVGVHVEFADSELDLDGIGELAARIEALGFSSLWTGEHVAFFTEYSSRHPNSSDGVHPSFRRRQRLTSRYDPFLLLMAVGARTTRLGLGTSVAILPQRHPITVAKMVATLDHLTKGRFHFGVGVGWSTEEYEALGLDFDRRRRYFEESIAAMRSLWEDDVSAFHGSHVEFSDLVSFPKPWNSPYERVYVGGKGPWCRRTARRFGGSWMPSSITLEQLAEAFRDGGDEAADPARTSVLYFPGGRWLDATSEEPGLTPDQIAETRRYVEVCDEMGVAEVVVKVNISSGTGAGLAELATELFGAVGASR